MVHVFFVLKSGLTFFVYFVASGCQSDIMCFFSRINILFVMEHIFDIWL